MSKLVIPGVIAQSGNGGGGTVDQTYDPTSTNAQSGTAVAEAVAPALKNTATGANALTILGTSATGTNQINIGKDTKINWGNNTIILGTGITSNGHNEIVIGSGAKSGGGCCTIIGNELGGNSWATFTTSIGYGNDCSGGSGSARLALGAYSKAQNGNTIAIGAGHLSNPAVASAAGSIQLGGGTNNTANSFQIWTYPMLDGTTGKIPVERLPSGNSIEVTNTMPTPSSSNVGQVKLYSGTTTSNFTNGYLYQCKLESTLEETVTFDSDKISAPAEMFWFIVKFVLPETYSSVTNGNITYTESANLVTFTFKDADNTVLGQFPGDVGELSAAGFAFNNLTDGDVINFTCFSGTIESYEWEPLIVQESSEIKIYNAPSWSQNTTLFPNCRLSLPNIDDLTEPGIFRVKYNESDENGSFNLDYLCNVSQFTTNGTIVGIFQSLQVIYPSVGNDSGINATLYRTKLSGGTWSNWKSSLVTSVSSNSIYSEYVSAKLFYDTCGNIEALINAL